MPRAALFSALVIAILSGPVLAQRAAPITPGGRSGFGGHRGFPNRNPARRGGFHRQGFGSYFLPYHDPLGDAQSENEVMPAEQPQIVTQRTPDAPVPKGQVIEIPAGANAGPAKVLPPTVFILANGERLESRRFVLTANLLSVSIDRQHRSVPLELLDIDATIAANHERGIDLRIPDDRNEISLRF